MPGSMKKRRKAVLIDQRKYLMPFLREPFFLFNFFPDGLYAEFLEKLRPYVKKSRLRRRYIFLGILAKTYLNSLTISSVVIILAL